MVNAKQNDNRFPQEAINKPTSIEKITELDNLKIFLLYFASYLEVFPLTVITIFFSLLSIRMYTDGLAFQLNSVIYKKKPNQNTILFSCNSIHQGCT